MCVGGGGEGVRGLLAGVKKLCSLKLQIPFLPQPAPPTPHIYLFSYCSWKFSFRTNISLKNITVWILYIMRPTLNKNFVQCTFTSITYFFSSFSEFSQNLTVSHTMNINKTFHVQCALLYVQYRFVQVTSYYLYTHRPHNLVFVQALPTIITVHTYIQCFIYKWNIAFFHLKIH